MEHLSIDRSRGTVQTQARLPGTGRVLVVEDEILIRETVEILIQIEGCDVRTASDGETGLRILEIWQPDLILLDLTLPRMTGRQFLRDYHETPGPHAPVILLTGRRLDLREATGMGAAGILPKPFDATQLLDLVASFTDCVDG